MQVFPVIDLMGGAAVRLEQGRRQSAKVYDRAPWEVAERLAVADANRLRVVDLDVAFTRGSRERLDWRQRPRDSQRRWIRSGGHVTRAANGALRLFGLVKTDATIKKILGARTLAVDDRPRSPRRPRRHRGGGGPSMTSKDRYTLAILEETIRRGSQSIRAASCAWRSTPSPRPMARPTCKWPC